LRKVLHVLVSVSVICLSDAQDSERNEALHNSYMIIIFY
jgi:hypothetical protein